MKLKAIALVFLSLIVTSLAACQNAEETAPTDTTTPADTVTPVETPEATPEAPSPQPS